MRSAVTVRRCENCKWWEPVDEDKSFGLCHFNAPVVTAQDDRPPWPFTDNTDWCKEMTAREDG
jgi:hypothetical protein